MSVIFFTFFGCEFKEVELQGVEILEFNTGRGTGVDGTLALTLYNPNNINIKVTRAKFNVMLNSVKVGEASLSEGLKIGANSRAVYPVKFTGNVSGALAGGIMGLLSMIGGQNPKVSFDGYIKARSMMIGKTFPVEFETDLPVNGFR
ncbi:MAG: hypothetical protein Kow0075_00860 [Salibacteraceae bacterium]